MHRVDQNIDESVVIEFSMWNSNWEISVTARLATKIINPNLLIGLATSETDSGRAAEL